MKIPFLHNVRRGLATNSSSSHSLVFHAEPVAKDEGKSLPDTEFGWDHFVLTDLHSKLIYGLTNAIGENWWKTPDDAEVTKALEEAKREYGHLFPELDDDEYRAALAGYVDHQSHESVTPEFVDKLRDPHVVVHGGNDNDGYPGIDYAYDEEAGHYVETDTDLPAGATREMLG